MKTASAKLPSYISLLDGPISSNDTYTSIIPTRRLPITHIGLNNFQILTDQKPSAPATMPTRLSVKPISDMNCHPLIALYHISTVREKPHTSI